MTGRFPRAPTGAASGSAGPVTFTLYADPNANGKVVTYVGLQANGVQTSAAQGTVVGSVAFDTTAGYAMTNYSAVSNGATFSAPLPGGLTLVPGSLVLGQSFVPYPVVTATVTTIGNVPGSASCPAGSPPGVTVSYAFGFTTELISFVPGCGITDLLTDNGTDFVLKSIGSYPQLGQLEAHRETMSTGTINSLRRLWQTVFTP